MKEEGTVQLHEIYKPKGEDIVVEFNKTDKTKAGLHIPEAAQKRDIIVKVIAVGPDVKTTKIGDLILVNLNSDPPLIPLISNNHAQIKEYCILGTVDPGFYAAMYTPMSVLPS